MPQARYPEPGSTIFTPRLAQNFQIRLRRGMIPHVHVHRRSDDDRSRGREIKRGEKVAGDALREVRQNVGSGGSNQQSINRLRDGNVLDGGIDIGERALRRAKTFR